MTSLHPTARREGILRTEPRVRIPGVETKTVRLDQLTRHPRNYRHHPPNQLQALAVSLADHGQYRPVVVAADWTILAGHGLVQAATAAGWTEIEILETAYQPDEPAALQLLAGDNTITSFAEDDQDLLAELLREVHDQASLLPTGYDDQLLAELLVPPFRPELDPTSPDEDEDEPPRLDKPATKTCRECHAELECAACGAPV